MEAEAAPKKEEPVAQEAGRGAVKRLEGTPVNAEAGKDWATPDGIEFVWIDALGCWVGRFEITNGDYRLMDPAHDSGNYKGASLDGERQPAVRLNFGKMTAFAAWLTERERAAGRIRNLGFSHHGDVESSPYRYSELVLRGLISRACFQST